MTSKAGIISLLTLFFSASGVYSQYSCGTDEYYQMQVKNNPELLKQEAAYNQQRLNNKASVSNRATIYTIPVVFHVFYTNSIENISRDQILDQMRILNEDYSFTNSNKSSIRSQFTGVAADCQIRFELAKIDPSGNCTDGINRVFSSLGVEVNRTTEDVKQFVQWDYRKYLNIWVVNSIAGTQDGTTTLGYAQFPFTNNPSRDGIVIRNDRVGSIGTALITADSGRTLTHEIGHWLGLYHTFQDGCTDGDLCGDTPPVSTAFANANCPANGNSCNTDIPDLVDQWENYMDYSRGTCMAMFTADQKALMHATLKSFPRNSNVSSSNLIATGVSPGTGAPVANFTSNRKIICAGSPVTFYDISCKATVTARSWTLPGSSSPSSTSAAPTVVYQTPGKYKVTLLVQNPSGNNTKSVDQYITVIDPNQNINPNFQEGFETNDLISRGFVSVSPKPWVVADVGYEGSHCLKAPVSTSETDGTIYSFQLPPVNVSLLKNAVPGPKFTFRVAYAPAADPNTNFTEILRIYASTDCGETFTQYLERTGAALAYSGYQVTSNFVPSSSSQWKLVGLPSLSSLGLENSTNVIFRIEVISAKGNPVYIDNINISSYNSGIKQVGNVFGEVLLFPNPAAEKATLKFEVPNATSGEISLMDLTGRTVKSIYRGALNAGLQSFDIEAPTAIAGTLYFVKITTEQGQIIKPITFAP